MRKLMLGLAFGLALFSGLPDAKADGLGACDRIRINGSNEWYPFAFRDDQGKAGGIGFAVAQALFERLNAELIIEPERPWKRNIAALNSGGLDVIAGAYWDSKRAREFAFTIPFAEDSVHIFVKQDRIREFGELAFLRGTNGVKPLGVSLGPAFEELLQDHVVTLEVSDYESMVRMVQIGRVDWFGLALYNGQKRLYDMKLMNEIAPLPFPLAVNQVYFMLPRNPRCVNLQERMNQALAKILEDGVVRRIIANQTTFALNDDLTD